MGILFDPVTLLLLIVFILSYAFSGAVRVIKKNQWQDVLGNMYFILVVRKYLCRSFAIDAKNLLKCSAVSF